MRTRTPLIAREEELGALDDAIANAHEGRGAFVLVAGEPGIGKTRLALEAADRAVHRKLTVAWGRCWEGGGAPALWPWIEAVRALDLRVSLESGGGLVGAGADVEQARFALFDEVGRALAARAREGPLLLVFDDLHVADRLSLMLLQFVARKIAALPLVVVGTYRDGDARMRPDARELLARVGREATLLLPRRLDAHQIQELLPEGLERGLVDRVYAVTEGNPLFVREIGRTLPAAANGASAARLITPLPGAIEDAIRGHLALLPSGARDLLAAAAVFGRTFPVTVLAVCSAIEEHEVRSVLAQGLEAGVLSNLDGVSATFAHVLLRDVLYRSLGDGARRAAHARVAAALAVNTTAADYDSLAQVAFHGLEAGSAGDPRSAVALASRAAAQARARLAFDEAADLCQRALDLDRLTSGLAPRERCELLVELCEALAGAGDAAARTAACDRARALATQLGAPDLLARAALAVSPEYTVFTRDEESAIRLREALDELGPADSALRARLLARLATVITPTEPDDPLRVAHGARSDEAREMARRLGDPETRLMVFVATAPARALRPPNELLAEHAEMVEIARRLGLASVEYRVRAWNVRALIAAGALGRAGEEIAALDAFLAGRGRSGRAAWVDLVRGTLACAEGRFDDAQRAARAVHEAAEREGSRELSLAAAFADHGILRARGDIGEILRWMAAAPGASNPLLRYWRAAFEDDREGASREAAQARAGLMGPVACAILAEAAARLGDRETCAWAYAALEAAGEQLIVPPLLVAIGCEGALSRRLAQLAEALGDLARAEQHFVAACAFEQRVGAPVALAHTRAAFAALLRRRASPPDAARAQGLAAQALATFDAHGLLAAAAALRAEPTAPRSTATRRAARLALPQLTLEREGDTWLLGGGAGALRLKDGKGVRYLAQLVGSPGRDFHVIDLVGAGEDPDDVRAARAGDAGAVLDVKAKDAYKRRLGDLRHALAEATQLHDPARASRIQEEMDALAGQLAQAVGLGGRDRRAASQMERARINVQRRLRDVLARIAEHDRPLARYLEASLRTGAFCTYRPLDELGGR